MGILERFTAPSGSTGRIKKIRTVRAVVGTVTGTVHIQRPALTDRAELRPAAVAQGPSAGQAGDLRRHCHDAAVGRSGWEWAVIGRYGCTGKAPTAGVLTR